MPQPDAWLHLPDAAVARRLRAGLMAVGVLPQVLHADAKGWATRLGSPQQPSGVVFLDVTHDPMIPGRPLDRAASAVPHAARSRTYLTRFAGGHVSAADVAWVRKLGFAGLIGDLGGAGIGDVLLPLMTDVARLCALPPPSAATLTRFVQVLRPAETRADARSLVHALAGTPPEAVCRRWADALPIGDQRHHLRTWARCVVGDAAVSAIAELHHLTRAEALTLGQAMGALGLIGHVTQEHTFQDAHLFYRLAWSEAADAVALDEVVAHLSDPAVLPVRARSHHGRDYPACWVGREAVDRVVDRWAMDRVDAEIVLQRVMAWGCFDHVLLARPFGDGDYFYRWRPPR